MAEGSVVAAVGAPVDEVWALVRDFGAVGDFFPGVESFRLEGDDRIIGMLGLEIRERLLERDDASRTLTYTIVDGVPVDAHKATISVAADGTSSQVTWSFDVEPESMAPIFADTYQKALEALAAHFA
ncbi:MAG: SRPBCC family protein [Acidimicrobiales bacterium]